MTLKQGQKLHRNGKNYTVQKTDEKGEIGFIKEDNGSTGTYVGEDDKGQVRRVTKAGELIVFRGEPFDKK